MTRNSFAFLIFLMLCSPALSLEPSITSALLRLDPVTRLEQRCDIGLMERIKREHNEYSPDRVVAYATKDPKIEGDEMKTGGAAFRSKGRWYRLRFKCETEPDHLTIRSVHYRIGDPIPEDEWKAYNLWR